MADNPTISYITLPNKTTYDIVDAYAREMIAKGFSYKLSTDAATTPEGITWTKDGTTITGTLVASDTTKGVFYLVPSAQSKSSDADIYDEYITVGDSTYSWEKLGNTQIELSDLGNLAYKSSASGSVTPKGSVGTPTITVTPSTTTVYVAKDSTKTGSTFTTNTPTAVTLPTFNVSNQTLIIGAGSVTAGSAASYTPPTLESQTVAIGISSATSSQPTFTGTSTTVTVS